MNFDIIVIGSGPGGYPAAIRASQLGKKVAIVERENLGGICLNWGCIPTKALLKSAQVFEYISHASDYGINVKDANADFGGMISRSRDVAKGMSNGVNFLMKKNKITVIEGTGKLVRGKKVEVTDSNGKKETYSADHIIIATGGRARSLPNVPIDGKKIIGYREAMTLPTQPKRMVVIGAGAIGVEFAYFYNAIGTEVTIVEFMEQGLVPREDPEVSKELGKIYKKKGITVLGNTAVEISKFNTNCAGTNNNHLLRLFFEAHCFSVFNDFFPVYWNIWQSFSSTTRSDDDVIGTIFCYFTIFTSNLYLFASRQFAKAFYFGDLILTE